MPFNFGKITSSKGMGSNESMLFTWLQDNCQYTGAFEFSSVEMQMTVPQWLLRMFEQPVTPDTLSRLWRKLREDYKGNKYESLLYRQGYRVDEFNKPNSKVKHFRVFKEG